MKLVKKTAEHRIYQKRSGRYAVCTARKQPVNGDDKAAILLAEGLVTQPRPKSTEAPAEPEAGAATE